jgi:hypothetical protein
LLVIGAGICFSSWYVLWQNIFIKLKENNYSTALSTYMFYGNRPTETVIDRVMWLFS